MDFKVSMIVGAYIQERTRTEELVHCLERNVANPVIQDIRMFLEDPKEKFDLALERAEYPALKSLKSLMGHYKVEAVEIYRRPLYRQYFEYANRSFPDGTIVMLANSDIEYDGTLTELAGVNLQNVFICLSRGLGNVGPSYGPEVSQDTWIWRSPIRSFKSNWTLGWWGGDNRIASEAQKASYEIVNPCLSINSIHHHKSGIRHRTNHDRLYGSYLSVYPSSIKDVGGAKTFVLKDPPKKRRPPGPPIGPSRSNG